jgi:hypothetical protein
MISLATPLVSKCRIRSLLGLLQGFLLWTLQMFMVFQTLFQTLKFGKMSFLNLEEYVDDNPAQHLFEFHKLMDELNVHHEDVLMKLFMFSLERDARLWYKSLPHSSIPSLKYFHILFHQHCKRIYSAEILFEDCCNIEFIRQKDHTNPLEEEEETTEISQVDEGDQHDEELADKETGYDSSCDHIQEEDIQHHGQPAEEKANNSCLIQKLHRPPPPLTKEEIDLLLNNYVTAPTHTDLQLSHSPGYECQTSSISENVNLFLNDDSHVFDGTLQEVSEPIYDDDFLPGDQLVDSILFHEKDVVVMFNSLEGSLLFKDALDCDLEEYESEIDIMLEKEPEFPMLEESHSHFSDI